MNLISVALIVIVLFQTKPNTTGRKISYSKKNVALISLIKEIRSQTGMFVIWNEKKIDVDKKMDFDFKDTDIEKVLNECAKKLGFSYAFKGNGIALIGEKRQPNRYLSTFYYK